MRISRFLPVLLFALFSVCASQAPAQFAPYPDELEIIHSMPMPPDVQIFPDTYACESIEDIIITCEAARDSAMTAALTSFSQYGERSETDDGWTELNDDWLGVVDQLQDSLAGIYTDWLQCQITQLPSSGLLWNRGWCTYAPSGWYCLDPLAETSELPDLQLIGRSPTTVSTPSLTGITTITFCSFAEVDPQPDPQARYPLFLGCSTYANISSYELWLIGGWWDGPFGDWRSMGYVSLFEYIMDRVDNRRLEKWPGYSTPRLFNSIFLSTYEPDILDAQEDLGTFISDVTDRYWVEVEAANVEFNGRPCLGDWNQDSGIDGDDIIAFMDDWDNNVAESDIDTNGGVDGDDLVLWFDIYDASGCW